MPRRREVDLDELQAACDRWDALEPVLQRKLSPEEFEDLMEFVIIPEMPEEPEPEPEPRRRAAPVRREPRQEYYEDEEEEVPQERPRTAKSSSRPKSASPKKKTKAGPKPFECYQCGFRFLRDLSKEAPDKKCTKCFTGVCGPRGKAPGSGTARSRNDERQWTQNDLVNGTGMGNKGARAPSAGSRMESQRGSCPRNNGNPHLFRFGKCSYCSKAEGKLIGAGAAANPGGRGNMCTTGRKHQFKFGVCSVCGERDL